MSRLICNSNILLNYAWFKSCSVTHSQEQEPLQAWAKLCSASHSWPRCYAKQATRLWTERCLLLDLCSAHTPVIYCASSAKKCQSMLSFYRPGAALMLLAYVIWPVKFAGT